MTNDYVCFAAVSEDGTIVRPVLSENQRWLKGEVPEVVPGRYISCDFLPTDSASVYPHATEDRKVNAGIQIGALLSNADLYRKALSMVDREVNGIFAGALQDEAYVPAGTKCRSLGSIASNPRRLFLRISHRGKVRLKIYENDKAFVFPVTDLAIVRAHEENRLDAFTNRLKTCASSVVLRLGLARAWGGKADNAFDPPRCYVQVNGIIFPE